MRLFIAIDLDSEARARVARAAEAIVRKSLTSAWKAVDTQRLHFTLKFLGEVEASRVSALYGAVDGAAACAQFRLRLSGVGAFHSSERARVVWIGVDEGAEQLRMLASRLDDACAAAGFPREERPFVPHLTVARPGRRAGFSRVVLLESIDLGWSAVDEIVLYQSELLASGPRYSALHAARLEVSP